MRIKKGKSSDEKSGKSLSIYAYSLLKSHKEFLEIYLQLQPRKSHQINIDGLTEKRTFKIKQ